MQKFISHESLAAGLFNRDECLAGPTMSPWAAQLTNTVEILLMVRDRLDADFLSQTSKMRRAFTAKDVATRLNACPVGIVTY